MMVEVNLSESIVNLNELLPVVGLLRLLIVLHQLELIGEATSQDQLVSSVLVERPNFPN